MNYIKLYYDLSGALTSVDNDIIVGRSHLSNKIQVYTDVTLAPGQDEAMQVYFVLANGQVTPKRIVANSGTVEVDGQEYYLYEYSIPSSVLAKVSSVNSNTLQVQFRKVGTEYDESTDATYYRHILALEMTTLTINASIIPNEDDDVVYVDEFTDLSTAIETKQNKDWTGYPTTTTINDTDYLTLANGTEVSNKTTVGSLLYKAQGNLDDLENDVVQLQDQFDSGLLTDGFIAFDQNVKTTDSPTFAGLTINGDITANKLTTNIVTSSIAFTSGSNVFGDQSTDKHTFTGSVAVQGDVTAHDYYGGWQGQIISASRG